MEFQKLLRSKGWVVVNLSASNIHHVNQMCMKDFVPGRKVYWCKVANQKELEGMDYLKVFVSKDRKIVLDSAVPLDDKASEFSRWRVFESAKINMRAFSKWCQYELATKGFVYRRDLVDVLYTYFGYNLDLIRNELDKLKVLGIKYIRLGDLKNYCYCDSAKTVWWMKDWLKGNTESLKKYVTSMSPDVALEFMGNAYRAWSRYAKYGYYASTLKLDEDEILFRLDLSKSMYELYSSCAYKGDSTVLKVLDWFEQGEIMLKRGKTVEEWVRCARCL